MPRRYMAAVVQMTSTAEPAENRNAAVAWIERAADRGAELVALPEMFTCFADPARIVAAAEEIPGATTDLLAEAARRLGVWILAGSIPEKGHEPGKIHNTSLLFEPTGVIVARYRKIHCFEVDIPGKVQHRESDFVSAGDEAVVVGTPLGRLGLAVCYDLRFPELFRTLADEGMEVLLIPSAFSANTGPDHWEPLLRARAIENQCFVLAPNQHGVHAGAFNTHGRSLIADPWGTVLASAADGPGLALAEIDLDRLEAVRARLPALRNRRPFHVRRPGSA